MTEMRARGYLWQTVLTALIGMTVVLVGFSIIWEALHA